MSGSHAAASIAMTISFLVSLAGEVLILVLVATVVRRHRPDAWRGLLAWAVASLVASIFTRVGWTVGLALAGQGGVDSVVTAQAVLTLVNTGITIVLFLLLARGLVLLAQPPKPVAIPTEGAYR